MTLPSDDGFPDLPIPSAHEGSRSVEPRQLKVLVVDDDVLMQRLLRSALGRLGFTQIQFAEDGAAGLEAVEREPPDIIISDYNMPKMHGLEFVEEVRRDDARDETVIIMLSASDDCEVIEGARDLGADTFIVKPFHRDDLKQLIETLYDRFNGARILWPE